MGLRSEGALVLCRNEGGEELSLADGPVGRAAHHALQELREGPAEELRSVLEHAEDVRDEDAGRPHPLELGALLADVPVDDRPKSHAGYRTRALKFGLRLIQHLGGARELVRLAALADRAGFDAVWFPHDPFMKHAWAMTLAVAEHTERVQIGAVGTAPYLNNPADIATYVATLDELSGGRALLGLGLHTGEMVEWLGYDAGDRVERTREAVELIRTLLRGEVASSAGGVYRWNEQAYLRFAPQRTEIPIYVAGFGRDLLELSGAIGDGSLPMITPPESAPLMVEPIRAGALAGGRDPAEVDISGCAWLSLSESDTAAADTLRPLVAYFGHYFGDAELGTVGLGRDDFLPLKRLVEQGRYEEAAAGVTPEMLRLAIVGTPGRAIEAIERLAAAGITHVNLGGPLGPDPAEAIRLLGERVIPHFRA